MQDLVVLSLKIDLDESLNLAATSTGSDVHLFSEPNKHLMIKEPQLDGSKEDFKYSIRICKRQFIEDRKMANNKGLQ